MEHRPGRGDAGRKGQPNPLVMPESPSHQQTLLVMPDDGVDSVVALIDQAEEQLLLKQFKLESEAIEQALLRAHQRGSRCG